MASSTPVQQGQKRPLSPEPSPSKDENQPSSKRATLKLNTIPPSEQQCLVPQAQQPTTSMEQRAFLTVPAINWVGLIASTDDTEQASTSSAQPSQTGEITNKNQGKQSELEDFLNRDLSFLQQTIFLFTKDENGKLRSNKSLLFLLAHLEDTELTDLANAVKCDGHYCLLKTSILVMSLSLSSKFRNKSMSFSYWLIKAIN